MYRYSLTEKLRGFNNSLSLSKCHDHVLTKLSIRQLELIGYYKLAAFNFVTATQPEVYKAEK